MKLEDIGFYTLSDDRANSSSIFSPLQRCELILGGRCNFKCPYCRGLRPDFSKDMTEEEALSILEIWCQNRLKNVRFSGGEPTIYKYLGNLVSFCKGNQVERIAISTNGSADISLYEDLLNRGVNDFSISLDSGCCSIGDKMAGGINGACKKCGKIAPEEYRPLTTKYEEWEDI